MSSHSNVSIPTQETPLEASQVDRVLRSASKRKQQQKMSQNSLNGEFAIDGQQNFPNSIEKQRYIAVEPHSPLNTIFGHSYQKPINHKETHNNAQFSLQIPESYGKSQGPNIINPKKCAQVALDLSFEDRNSVQTMDSKQFSSSFEFDESLDKSSQGMNINRMTLAGPKNKNYFDQFVIKVIQNDEENEEEKRTEANGQDNFSQRSGQKIELQRDNSETHYDQSAKNSDQCEKSLSNLDIEELKVIEKRKIHQKNEIAAAYNQTKNENEFIAEQVKTLEKKIEHVLSLNQIYRRYEQIMTGFKIKLNTKKFDQSVRHFRKFSL